MGDGHMHTARKACGGHDMQRREVEVSNMEVSNSAHSPPKTFQRACVCVCVCKVCVRRRLSPLNSKVSKLQGQAMTVQLVGSHWAG